MVREYVGARYVPKFSDVNGGDWDNSYTYEALEIVKYGNDFYTSKKPVPVGVDISDGTYWVLTGNYNGAIAALTSRVSDLENAMEDKAFIFDSVASMRSADLEVGDIVETSAYYDSRPGGGSVYIITNSATPEDGGSVINLANGYKAELVVFEQYITPEQFGCKTDGATLTPTDNSAMLQKALDYCASALVDLKCGSRYYVDNELTVGDGVSIFSDPDSERNVTFYVGGNVSVLFTCETRNKFENISIRTVDRVYRDYVAIDIQGDASGNCDCDIINCVISFTGTGLYIRGRNVNVIGTLFSHCKYGVLFDFPNTLTNIRGLLIDRCRFHGIGEEAAIAYNNSASIYIKTTSTCDLIIRNCLHDQGGTFFEGYALSVQMINNYVCHYEKPAILINPPSLVNPYIFKIDNNKFIGLKGTDAAGLPHTNYPDYSVEADSIRRLSLVNNSFENTYKSAIFFDNISWSNISSNEFHDNTNGDASNACMILDDCRVLAILNNVGVFNSSQEKLSQSSDGVKYATGYMENNIFFGASTDFTPLS